MEFKRTTPAATPATKRRRLGVHSDRPDAAGGREYPHKLQMYRQPPLEIIALLDLETLAIQRLKLLKAIEREAERGQRGSQEWTARVRAAVEDIGLLETVTSGPADAATAQEARRRDHISHFILRLAFCKTASSRQWFLAQETELFRLRFGALSAKACNDFLHLNNMDYDMMSLAEGGELAAEVRAASGGWAERSGEDEFCRVPFTEALDLVRQRRCHLADGFAYVLRSDITSIIAQRFKADLARALALAHKYSGFADEETRLAPFLAKLNARTHIGESFVAPSGEQIRARDLVGLKQSMPPCMGQIMDDLRSKGHAKHFARQQLGLFLKGIGVPLEEALEFWRVSLRSVDADRFTKDYAYNIRHNYGKEGRRKDYTPPNCVRIGRTGKPGPGDCHGCPFVHSDDGSLEAQLKAMGLSDSQRRAVIAVKGSGRADLACSRTFEAVHKLPEGSIPQLVSHPNLYFSMSRDFRSGKASANTLAQAASNSQQPQTSQ